MISTLLLVLGALGAELEATYDPVLALDATPELRFVSVHHPASILVECEVGGKALSWEFPEVGPGATHRVQLPRSPAITQAACQVLARFANGHSEGVDVDMKWSFVQLDHEGAGQDVSVDLQARVATVPAPFPAIKATVRALDSRGDPIFEEPLSLRPRSGRITLRWTQPGAERASTMRFELEGEHGETVVFDIEVRRQSR